MNKLINKRIVKIDQPYKDNEVKFYCCKYDNNIDIIILTFIYPIYKYKHIEFEGYQYTFLAL